MNQDYVLEMRQITKSFYGVKALDGVSFNLKKGEVHSLIGENGAGKSTLIKVLGGLYTPDAGEIFINSKKAYIHSSIDSLNKKISIIYQEFNLVPTLTVGENIFLGKELRGKAKMIDRKAMTERATELMQSLGIKDMDCSRLVEDLSVAKQQMVEIAKALFYDSNIIVMDEPTAVLTGEECEALFATIRKFQEKGTSIIYISHRLEEIQSLSDRITVLRDGKFIAELDNTGGSVTKEIMVRHMVGRDLADYFPERKVKPEDQVVIRTDKLTKDKMYYDISFHLNKGEILGFFGLVGAGRTEVMKTIFGAIRPDAGSVEIEGVKTHITGPSDAVGRKIALVPEDRKKEGLVLSLDLSENIVLSNTKLVSRFGIFNASHKAALSQEYIKSLEIRPATPDRLVNHFSGGNQQKIVLAKWLATHPKIIIMDEPTRGIDIAAKREIYEIINELTVQGVSIIVVSSEMLEVLGICDRIIVMYEGRITGEFQNKNITQEQLMACASGITQ